MNKIFLTKIVAAATLVAALPSCSSHQPRVDRSITEKELTPGLVQKEIRKGMGQDQVAASLGSPNIVTRDKEGKETWIYDKIASDAAYSNRDSGLWLIIAGTQKSRGKSSTSQRTLTVLIKFDEEQTVDTFSYHASKF